MVGRLAGAAVVAVACLAGAGGAAFAASDWTNDVKSMPGFRIPKVFVTARDDNVAPGYIFLTPRTQYPGRTGPTILDKDGHVIWFHPQSHRLSSQDLRPQLYRGKPVLTWSVSPPLLHEGDVLTRRATPRNTYNVIADSSYHIIKRVRARGRGVITDGHEFLITGRDTALVLGGRPLLRRLKRYGGPKRGTVVDNVVQEINLRTGRLLFTWSATRHIPLRESMVRPPRYGPWDAIHLNSISVDSDGNLLLSARHTSTIYKVARHSGRIMWKLGGKDSSFRMGRGADFFYQHFAVRQKDGTITLFDNGAMDRDKSHTRHSVAKQLRIDTRRHTATLVRSFKAPPGSSLATSQGSASVLGNENVFVGWGISPWFSEYAPDGRLLFAGRFQSVWHHSYRAFKSDWHATPGSDPAIAARVSKGSVAAYASWNGATEVTSWRLMGGSDPDNLSAIGSVPWANFETRMVFPGEPAYVEAQALDAAGTVIGLSDVIKPKR